MSFGISTRISHLLFNYSAGSRFSLGLSFYEAENSQYLALF